MQGLVSDADGDRLIVGVVVPGVEEEPEAGRRGDLHLDAGLGHRRDPARPGVAPLAELSNLRGGKRRVVDPHVVERAVEELVRAVEAPQRGDGDRRALVSGGGRRDRHAVEVEAVVRPVVAEDDVVPAAGSRRGGRDEGGAAPGEGGQRAAVEPDLDPVTAVAERDEVLRPARRSEVEPEADRLGRSRRRKAGGGPQGNRARRSIELYRRGVVEGHPRGGAGPGRAARRQRAAVAADVVAHGRVLPLVELPVGDEPRLARILDPQPPEVLLLQRQVGGAVDHHRAGAGLKAVAVAGGVVDGPHGHGRAGAQAVRLSRDVQRRPRHPQPVGRGVGAVRVDG